MNRTIAHLAVCDQVTKDDNEASFGVMDANESCQEDYDLHTLSSPWLAREIAVECKIANFCNFT